jgi:hypothetical protein
MLLSILSAECYCLDAPNFELDCNAESNGAYRTAGFSAYSLEEKPGDEGGERGPTTLSPDSLPERE